MRKIYLFTALAGLLMAWGQTSAQTYRSDLVYWDINIPGLEIPPLIFSEFRGDNNAFYYLELTNVGTEEIDLSNFTVLSVAAYAALENARDIENQVSLRRNWHYIPLEGTLGAGESYVMANAYDEYNEVWNGLTRHNIAILDVADIVYHQPENNIEEFLNKPEWGAFGKDSVSMYYPRTFISGSSGYYLQYEFTNGDGLPDSTIIDNVNISIDPYAFNGRGDQGTYQTPVAGVEDAIDAYILVRKSTVTQGIVDWDLARGTDLATSDWLPVPEFNNKFEVFTTVGSHGDFSLDYSVKDGSGATLDENAKTLTVPWATVRDESVSKLLNVGPNMSWAYTWNPTVSDSAYTNVRDGDTFTLYALNDLIDTASFTIKVATPAADIAIVFPKNFQVLTEDESTGELLSNWFGLYSVTDGLDVDSIFNVPFGTRMDTLFKYLTKPENATWEVVTGGEERADVHDGDILRVTSENGSVVKDYLIQVADYEPSSNANLSMISWPDVDLATYWQWASDTIPNFTPQGGSYFIELVDGTTTIPALQFKTINVNAKIAVKRAISIDGTLDQRTTTVTVTAEDGETTKTYKIEFRLASVTEQPNYAEPFITELTMGMNFAYNVEIYNPGNRELDLSKYMLVRGTVDQNFGEAVTGGVTTNSLNNVYRNYYVPGMRFQNDADITAYSANPGLLTPDNITNTIVQPGDVFVVGTINDGGWPGGRFYPGRYFEGYTDGSRHDMILYGWSNEEADSNPTDAVNDQYNLNPWGLKLHRYYNATFQDKTTSLFLVKIEDQAILDGTKPVNDLTDPNSYTIIDRWQKPLESDTFYVAGRHMDEYLTNPRNGWVATRKPHVNTGATERGQGFGDNLGRSEENTDWTFWNVRDEDKINQDMIDGVGWHSMDPVLTYVSTVTSTRYHVTPGFEGSLTITGTIDGLTVADFLSLIDKGEPGQTLVVSDGTSDLTSDQAIAAGMNLIVTSADETNTTTYELVNSPLDADNLLVAADGSGLTVSLTEAEGTVAGVAAGITISALLENLVVPSTAVLNIIDQNDNLLSLKVMNFDSVLVDREVGENVFLEVVAENGDAAVYSLDFGLTNADAVLFSDVLSINQEILAVYGVPGAISVAGLADIVYTNEGASMMIMDKLGYQRTAGRLYADDVVHVVSADESVTVVYNLNFVYETNTAPVASIDGPAELIIDEPVNFSSTVSDDGLPAGSSLTYLWEVTSGSATAVTIASSDQPSTDITISETGEFEISLTVSDSELSTTVSTTVTSVVGVEPFDMESIIIYPNPAREQLFVDLGSITEVANVTIVDIIGHILYNETNIKSNLEISLDSFDSGMYFLSIEIDDKVSTHKVIVSKDF